MVSKSKIIFKNYYVLYSNGTGIIEIGNIPSKGCILFFFLKKY